MAGGINTLASLQCKTDSNNALVVTVDSSSSGVVTSITGTAGQVLANGTSGSAQTGAVTLTLAAALTGIDSLTFSGGQSLVGTTANVTELRNSTNGQELRIGPTTGYLRVIKNAGAEAIIRTSDAFSLRLGANNSSYWDIGTSGHLTALTDNTYDIGASGATRPKNAYIAGFVDVPLYKAGGTSGVATFGPAAVASITVKGGIITAIS